MTVTLQRYLASRVILTSVTHHVDDEDMVGVVVGVLWQKMVKEAAVDVVVSWEPRTNFSDCQKFGCFGVLDKTADVAGVVVMPNYSIRENANHQRHISPPIANKIDANHQRHISPPK
jgi:hypothetical protein